ncbi:MAG: helix-turn-helix transcriptional regulator [Longicatena sp.]
MDVLKKLDYLMKQKHMSESDLANAANMPLSTIDSLFKKGNCPTLPTLESMCRGLDISLSDFFYEGEGEHIQELETQKFLKLWYSLGRKEKNLLFDFMNLISKN